MWPLWVWLSRIEVAEDLDKASCEQFCSDKNAKLITVGHLEHATAFTILREKFIGPPILENSKSILKLEPHFRAHVDATFDWKTKVKLVFTFVRKLDRLGSLTTNQLCKVTGAIQQKLFITKNCHT